MPTERSWLAFAGISLVAAGMAWENLLGPSLIGWGAIVSGHLALVGSTCRETWRTALDWPIVFLVLTAGIAVWATRSIEATMIQVTRLLSSIAGLYGLVRWSRGPARLAQTGVALLGSGVILAAIAPFIVDWDKAKGIPIPASIYELFPSLASDVVHPNIMATLMVVLFPLAFALGIAPMKREWPGFWRWRALAVVACAAMGLVLIMTKSRGGYIAGAVGLLAVLGFYKRRRPFIVATTVLIALASLLVFADSARPVAVDGGVTDPGTWEFRIEVWRLAALMIGDFPLTGVGMGMFNDVASRLYPFSPVDNPGAHNVLLQVGVDLGLLGLIAYVSIALATLRLGYLSVTRLSTMESPVIGGLVAGSLAGFLSFVTHGLIDNAAWGSRASFVPWLIVGLIHALHAYLRESSDLNATKPRRN